MSLKAPVPRANLTKNYNLYAWQLSISYNLEYALKVT